MKNSVPHELEQTLCRVAPVDQAVTKCQRATPWSRIPTHALLIFPLATGLDLASWMGSRGDHEARSGMCGQFLESRYSDQQRNPFAIVSQKREATSHFAYALGYNF
jgi:hypothetical protein